MEMFKLLIAYGLNRLASVFITISFKAMRVSEWLDAKSEEVYDETAD